MHKDGENVVNASMTRTPFQLSGAQLHITIVFLSETPDRRHRINDQFSRLFKHKSLKFSQDTSLKSRTRHEMLSQLFCPISIFQIYSKLWCIFFFFAQNILRCTESSW